MATNQYEWDLTKFCKDDETWHQKLEELKTLVDQFGTYENRLHDKKVLKEYYDLNRMFHDQLMPLYMYAENNHNKDLSNPTYIEMSDMLSDLSSKKGVKDAFYSSEMLLGEQCGEQYLKELIADPVFEEYVRTHENLLQDLPHTLTAAEEKVVARLSAASNYSNIFDAIDGVDMHFEDALDSEGKVHKVTNSNYSMLMESKDRTFRKNVSASMKKGISHYENTLAENFKNNLQADWAFTEVYRYDSVLGSQLEGLRVSKATFDNLIQNVNEHLDLNHEYYAMRKKILGYEKLYGYDLSVPLVDAPQTKLTFEEAYGMVKTALKDLGEDYVGYLDQAIQERWIDVYPTQNKQTGAYSWGCYGYTPVVLLNFNGTVEDVSTIAHEMGHAINDVYARHEQPRQYASPRRFLTEVASTTNEVLMLKYLIKNAKSLEEKMHFLDTYCSLFNGTMFAQVKLTEFEQFVHDSVQNSKPLTKDNMAKKYLELSKKYAGEHLENNNEKSMAFLTISHFYRPFYCFQYATGIAAAVCLASKVYNHKENAVENLKTFLKSGSKKLPNQILKDAGVDLETNEPYLFAFAEYKWALKEMELTHEKLCQKYANKKPLTKEVEEVLQVAQPAKPKQSKAKTTEKSKE